MIYRFSQILGTQAHNPSVDGGLAAMAVSFRSDMEREYPLIQQHDIESLDIKTARRLATECAYISGAQVELFHRTDNASADPVWDEDPDPTYWAPSVLKGFYAPKTVEVALKNWGSDAAVKLNIFFSYSDLIERFGERLIRAGDIVRVPYNAIGNVTPKYFRVINASPSDNFRYSWLFFDCAMESITGDITVHPEPKNDIALGDYLYE